MNPGNVPTAVVAPVLAALIEDRWPSRLRPDAEEYGITILAEKAGCHVDSIDTILRQKHPGAEFDLVDRLLCALGRPDMWIGTLADVYPTRFLSKCAAPGCARKFKEFQRGDNVKRYCSRRCASAASNVRRGLGSGNTRMGRCRQGHRLTPENSVSQNGRRTCRTCRLERQRRWAAEKRKDPAWREKRNEAQRRWRAKLAA